ncbi:MAG: TIGR03936 family radical SAM-associated protein [Clostridiaceae bacterium]|nr:TIGR03936 family radical SAM-associated protein [Clostridiaceae bacterium]
MRDVRIFFEKKDMAKYISHLDLMRCFSRAVKRAGIDIWYTEGFNPHPFMTFSLPLSLGTESFCESVDIRTNDEMPFDEIKERFQSTLPDGIRVTKVAAPVHKANEICFSEFEILFYTEKSELVLSSLKEKIEADEINAEKKAKQGRKKVFRQVNIKENIHSFDLSEAENGVLLKVVLTAGVKNNINPSLLIDAITADVKDEIKGIDIKKTKMMLEDMKEFE